ncbi:MAG: amidohydrolase family protein [Dehalobacterium sp.]
MTLKLINSRKSYVLIPDSILDIAENRVIKGKALAVKEGVIADVLFFDQVPLWAEREHALKIPLDGLTLMPGLVDCHVHFALDSVDFKSSLARWNEPESLLKQINEINFNFLQNGVLAVRDGGDNQGIGFAAKKQANDGLVVRTTGWAVRRNGYYGSFLGPGVDTVNEAKGQVSQLVDMGVDQIKLIVSGIVSFSHYGKVGAVQFSLADLKEIVQECHYQGRKVMAHASSEAGVAVAVASGVDSIEHGYFVSDRSLELMGERGTAWVPTIIPVKVQTESPYSQFHDREGLNVIKKTYLKQMEQLKKAASLGVLLGIGTDAGAVGALHGFSYFKELEMYQEAGLSQREILRAAIFGGSVIAGLDRWGKIKRGSPAGLIAVKGNPLADLFSLKNTEMIVLPQNY